MYRLLIADDEALEREGIEWIVTRMMPNIFEIIHAENGRVAIQKAEEFHPHIIMMDIRMPGIQGLEALKEIKAVNPNVKMVMVTAYEYFEYAKAALALGVKDYLVKPAKRDQIVALLERLVVEIEQEQRKRDEELAIRDKYFQLLPLADVEIALDLMTDQVNEIEVQHLADIVGLSTDKGCAIVLAFPELGDAKKKIYDTVKSFSYGTIMVQCGSVVSSMVHGHMAIFLLEKKQTKNEVIRTEAMNIGTKLAETLHQQNGITISVGIGSVREQIEGIRQSYYEAVFASTNDNKWGSICHFEDLNIVNIAGSADAVYQKFPDYRSNVGSSYVEVAIQQIREEREKRTWSVLDRAITYMKGKYHEELSLEDVADHVHLNPYYFSKIFKKQTGETFIDYLTKLRIEKAKEFMQDSQLSMKEVCYLVGYNDPNYFSRVFKKVTGLTPSEYRLQLTN